MKCNEFLVMVFLYLEEEFHDLDTLQGYTDKINFGSALRVI